MASSKSTYYDSRAIAAHGNSNASVILVNEAPGPDEAEGGFPLIGQQGANVFHTLQKARVAWALKHERFSWPTSASASGPLVHQKNAFLASRAEHLTCTNAYPYWPRPDLERRGFVAPEEEKVLSADNLVRMQSEVHDTHRVLLVCGAKAYLACCGVSLDAPGRREGTPLSDAELEAINKRLKSHLLYGWYLGHTRRWSLKLGVIKAALSEVEVQAGW